MCDIRTVHTMKIMHGGSKLICIVCIYTECTLTTMDLIHYLFASLILFRVPYMLYLLPYYLSIANGAGGVGIFELLVFQCFV